MSSIPSRGAVICAMALATMGLGCKGAGDEAPSPEAKVMSGDDSTPAVIDQTLEGGMAIPQEELIKSTRAIKISGTLTVEGYTKGLLQIDVLKDKRGPQRPVTTARFDKPGAYDMYVPSGLGPLTLNAILDFESDGPNMSDPTGAYAKGSIEPDGAPLTGVDIVIDLTNIQLPPPQDQPKDPSAGGGDKSLNIDDTEDSEIILKASGD